MAENPHLLANEIHGTFGPTLTGINFPTRITGLANDFPTGNAKYDHLYKRVLREYYRNLDNHGFTGFQTDVVDAGFTPLTITGFFDPEINSLLPIYLLDFHPGAAAAFSLRPLNSNYSGPILFVRRDADDAERSFTALEVEAELEDWVNGKLETTLPADSSFGGAAAAYSLRKVNPAYSGNAVHIRRVSDNVEVNVAFDSNDEVSNSSVIAIVSGSSSATTLGEFLTEGGNQDATVVTWYNQSGGNNATQPSTGLQPKIAENGNLLADGIRFDGSQTLDTGALISNINSVSSFVVYKETTQPFLAIVFGQSFSGSSYFFAPILYDADIQFGYGSNALISLNDTRDSNFHLVSAVTDSSENRIRASLDGSEETFVSLVDAPPNITDGGIGSLNGNYFFEGNIKEIIVYDSDQIDNRFKIESNINNYYGIYTPTEDGFVKTWYDQSGKDEHTTNTNLKIVSNGNYLGYLEFAGTLGETPRFSLDIETEYSFFSVSTDAGSTNTCLVGVGSNSFFGIQYGETISSGGERQLQIRHGNQTESTSGVLNGESLISQTYDSSTVNLHLNGELVGTSEMTVSIPSDNAKIGDNEANLFVGRMKELIIYTSDQAANRTAIESNIADEYGITLS